MQIMEVSIYIKNTNSILMLYFSHQLKSGTHIITDQIKSGGIALDSRPLN